MIGRTNFLLTLALILVSLIGHAQVIEPATWSHELSAGSVKVGEEIDLIFKAEIHPDWYLYSSDFECDIGPMVTTFTFGASDAYTLVGNIQPIDAKKKYDEIFECDYTYFKVKGEFRQTIKVLKPGLVINGTYEYQVCTDVDGKCIPFEEEFTFGNIEVIAAKTTEEPVKTGKTKEQKSGKVPGEAKTPEVSQPKSLRYLTAGLLTK